MVYLCLSKNNLLVNEISPSFQQYWGLIAEFYIGGGVWEEKPLQACVVSLSETLWGLDFMASGQ